MKRLLTFSQHVSSTTTTNTITTTICGNAKCAAKLQIFHHLFGMQLPITDKILDDDRDSNDVGNNLNS